MYPVAELLFKSMVPTFIANEIFVVRGDEAADRVGDREYDGDRRGSRGAWRCRVGYIACVCCKNRFLFCGMAEEQSQTKVFSRNREVRERKASDV